MRKGWLISLSILLIGLLAFSTVNPILASTEVDNGAVEYLNKGQQNISGHYSNTVNRPQDRILQVSSGKIIILDYPTQNTINIRVYSSTGVLEDTTPLPSITGGSSLVGGVEMAQYSSTQIIIMYCGLGTSTHASFYVFNFNAYSGTQYQTGAFPTMSGTETVDRIGQLYYYNGVWWCMILYDSYYGGGYCIWAEFTVATLTASFNTQVAYVHYAFTSEIMSFQDANNLNLVYLVSSKAGSSASDQTTPQYYVFDMSTGVMALLATNGVNAVMPDGASNIYTQPYSNMLTYLGGGIYNTGTYYYLYHSWVYSIGTATSSPAIRTYKIVIWIGEFNNTISSGSLISQSCIDRVMTDNSGGTFTTPGMAYGLIAYDKVVLPKMEFDVVVDRPLGGYHNEGWIWTINNLTAMKSDVDAVAMIPGVDNLDITYKADNANVARNPLYDWSYQEDSVSSYLFMNEREVLTVMAENLTYTPLDNPLIQGNTYVFTWVIYKNGIVDINGTDKYTVYFDNYPAKSNTLLDSNGRAIVSITSSLVGNHIISIDVWDSTDTLIYHGVNHTYNWVASSSGGGGTLPIGPITTGWYNLLVIWVPIFMFVVAPMLAVGFLGAKYGGGTGMFLGIIFGGFGGVIAGVQMLILDTYVLYLYILLIAIGLVFALSSRGNSNG